jgi:hypothetical protein
MACLLGFGGQHCELRCAEEQRQFLNLVQVQESVSRAWMQMVRWRKEDRGGGGARRKEKKPGWLWWWMRRGVVVQRMLQAHTHTEKTCVTGRTQATCGAVHNQLGMLLWRREGGRFMAAHSSPLASRRAQRKVCSWCPLVEIRPAIWVHNENSSQAHSLLPTRETESIIHLFFLKNISLSHITRKGNKLKKIKSVG